MAIATGTALLASAFIGAGTAAYSANAQKKALAGASATPPDYSTSTNQGVTDDAGSLALRLQINQAAQNGTVFTDPATGKVYDFRGTLDTQRFYAAFPDAKKDFAANPEGRTAEQHARDWLAHTQQPADRLAQFYTGSQAYRNQTDIDSATQLAGAGAELTNQSLQNQLRTYLQFLPEFNKLNLDQQDEAVRRSLALLPSIGTAQRDQDTLTFNNNLALGQGAARSNAALQNELLPGVNKLSLDMQQDAFNRAQAASFTSFAGNLDQADIAAARATAQQTRTLPALNELSLRLQTDALTAGDAAGRRVNGGLYGVRDTLARTLQEELNAGDDLTPAQQRKVQQRIRGAQASRGNILGDGAAFDEAIAESDYAQDMVDRRRSTALGLLNARELNPNFSAVGVVNPTQVVAPNLGPANFTATTAVNPLMPNYAPATAPNLTATTAGMPTTAPANITTSNPLGLLNPNAGNNAASYNLSAWTGANTAANNRANQPNPWLQGIGLGLRAYGAFAG
jgi:hypothetical protein